MANERFWAWVGKIATLLTAIGGVIGLYRVVFPSGPVLRIRAEYQPFAISPDLLQSLAELRQKLDKPAIAEVVNTVTPNAPEVFSTDVYRAILDYLEQVWPFGLVNEVDEYRSFWQMEVRNDGSRAALDAVLDVAFKGIALISGDGRLEHAVEFDRRILIGEVRPGNKLMIMAWSESDVPTFASLLPQQIKVTHSAGVGSVAYPIKVWGLTAWLVKYWFLLVLFLWILVVTRQAWLPVIRKWRTSNQE